MALHLIQDKSISRKALSWRKKHLSNDFIHERLVLKVHNYSHKRERRECFASVPRWTKSSHVPCFHRNISADINALRSTCLSLNFCRLGKVLTLSALKTCCQTWWVYHIFHLLKHRKFLELCLTWKILNCRKKILALMNLIINANRVNLPWRSQKLYWTITMEVILSSIEIMSPSRDRGIKIKRMIPEKER